MKKWLKTLISFVSVITLFLVGTNVTEAKSTKAANKPVTIYLARHGETTANVMHLAQGWSDFTLTDNGVKGAQYLGLGLKGVKFRAAYSGDLTRQEKTAQGALDYSGNKKIKLQIDPRLRECNYGSYEGRQDIGKNVPEIAEYYGYKDVADFQAKTGKLFQNKMQDGYYALDKANKLNTTLPEQYRAEQSTTVQKRMTAALTAIAKKQQKKGGNVLVVSSGMSINMFLSAQDYPEYQGVGIANDAVTKLVYKNGKFKLAGPIGDLKYFNAGKKAADR
ncbi:histidine phosphatase family protein [Lactobacillus sp. ESL0677]|uniref:histidine phosphatase family protein n=1 Tax=Lactobacillus sp. ESL0677 TaxID=2983208 RepID=UPI0023F72DF8|nr:histidine phosphatase family protein [Lactobacillus sp. ESL0677]WEV36896.1 histidine phosphatase family protein [Lactobacillus sp. ESL0677]